jgi:chorismate mutase
MTTAVNSPMTDTDATDQTADQSAQDTIDMLREQIDALDAALIRIVAERARVSRRIQSTRMNAGGTRVELGRERTVRNRFRDGLGPDGATLAEAVLQVCRGTR